jgi:hypothetical protein
MFLCINNVVPCTDCIGVHSPIYSHVESILYLTFISIWKLPSWLAYSLHLFVDIFGVRLVDHFMVMTTLVLEISPYFLFLLRSVDILNCALMSCFIG